MKETFTEKKILGIRMIAFEAYKSAFHSSLTVLERDSAILLYLEIIDSLEVLYFKTLMNMCKELKFEFFNLQSCYDTAADNMVLFEGIRTELLALN
jgi:hypothetical protein